jgi:hypothetical protein
MRRDAETRKCRHRACAADAGIKCGMRAARMPHQSFV